tara:strand:- start:81 stop:437 length:357 start_codon:yes stop_codon:yes gene_type:complete
MDLTVRDAMMLYQTTLRNVGLYTSVSLALLGYSRFYRGKGNTLYNISFIVISMIFLLFALVIVRNLLADHDIILDNFSDDEKEHLLKWYQIPVALQYVLGIILLFSAYTLVRQVRDNK